MTPQRRLVALAAALVVLAFGAAYALAGDDGDAPEAAPPAERGAPSPIATPDGVEVPGVPDGDDLPDLVVPTRTPQPGDETDPGPSPTPAPGTDPDPAPTVVPQPQDPDPTPQPTPEPEPLEEGGGED